VQVAVVTIAARARLAETRALAASLRAADPRVRLIVVLADETGEGCDPRAEPFEVVPVAELGIAGWRALAFRYEREPFSYVLTPFVLEALLERGGLDAALFLKQETLVTGRLDAVLAALREAAVVLTPHLLAPCTGPGAGDREALILRAGVFNGGVLGVSAGRRARAFLRWWGAQVRDRCVLDLAAGLHYEQRWLDHVPSRFPGVHVLRDPAVNVGHWNLREREPRVDGDAVVLGDGRPVAIARFSGYEPERPDRATRYLDEPLGEHGPAAALFARWHAALLAERWETTHRLPYAFDRFADGAAIPPVARELHRELGAAAEALGDPFSTGPGTFRAWLEEPAPGRGTPLPRFWAAVWERRADLREAFPAPRRRDAGAYADWIERWGRAETGALDVA
jgi:hypothetical protein